MSNGNQAVQSDFLYKAIDDTQSTIRAIDTKISALLVILVIPLTKLDKIYAHCSNIWVNATSLGRWLTGLILVGLFAISWIGSFLAAMRTLIAIDNPADHVNTTDDKALHQSPGGTFYGGYLFKFGCWKSVFTKGSKSTKTLWQHLGELPEATDKIQQELAFEHMKLCYIRHIKIKRQEFAFGLAVSWVAWGGIIWLLSLSR